MEHITTQDAVEFCMAAGDNVAATITPQHIMLNRNAMLLGGRGLHSSTFWLNVNTCCGILTLCLWAGSMTRNGSG
jgi:dihydroorotase